MRLSNVLFAGLLLVAGTATNSEAYLSFYGYRGSIPRGDSIVRYFQTKIGYAQLETSEISITPRGGYLDITEDAWISSSLTSLNRSGLTDDYLFKGSLPIPRNAVVTGLHTWKGDTLYRAVLRKTRYNYDASYPDSLALQRALDTRIAFLEQHTEDHYELALARVSLGERKHVRIRYLLANAEGGMGHYAVPVLFHPSRGKEPQYVKLSFRADSAKLTYFLNSESGPILLADNSTRMVPYQRSYSFRYADSVTATLHTTSFATGPWAGTYMQLNATLTDSVLAGLSKPIQTVFVWRWNAPQDFVVYDNQMKGLSDYAYTVINQAESIEGTLRRLSARGYECGLLHSIEGKNKLAFKTSGLSDSSAVRAVEYLNTFNEHYLYERYVEKADALPSWVPREAAERTDIQKARDELIELVETATSMMPHSKIDHRHIIISTVGSIPYYHRKNLDEEIDSLVEGYTIAANSAAWRGVGISQSMPSLSIQKLVSWHGYYFPPFAPVSVQIRLGNQSQPYYFPLSAAEGTTFSMSARTSRGWDTTFQWIGYDPDGEITAVHETKPLLFEAESDSGLAKVWAGDESHLAEKEEVYPGGTYGVVTKATFLGAGTEDLRNEDWESVPYLADDEIMAPRTALKDRRAAVKEGINVTWHSGTLRIRGNPDLRTLKIFDHRGRLVLSVSLERFRRGATFRIPLRSILGVSAQSILIVVVEGGGARARFTLTPGGIS